MRNFKLPSIIFLVVFVFFINFTLLFAETSNNTNVNLQVGIYCNNNGMCEDAEGILNCPSDCTPKNIGSSGSSIIGADFNNLTIDVIYNSATIKWKSVIPTMYNVKWGTNIDYKDGVLQNINFLLDHEVVLSNLKEGTFYYFKIQTQNILGKKDILDNQFFRTLSSLDTTPPSNISNVSSSLGASGITISWNNPKESDFDYIRILKNTGRYYGSPYIGYVVYEGKGSYFTDSNVIEGTKYFYSLFARDKSGNYSSGSLIDVVYHSSSEINISKPEIPQSEITQPEKIKTPIEKYIITQASSIYDLYPGSIFNLRGDEPINIKTNYSSVTQNDDTWIEIKNKFGVNSGKYLFSRIKDKDNFISVTIPSFLTASFYGFTIYRYTDGVPRIVNYGSLQISNIQNTKNIDYTWYIILFIILILVILWRIIIIFRRLIKK